MKSINLLFVLAIAATITPNSDLIAEDWPNWRGPRNDGTSTESGLPSG